MYLDIAGVVFIALNSTGEVTLVNKKGCEILGYEEEAILGKNWFDHFLPRSAKGRIQTIFQKLITGEVAPFEYVESPIRTRFNC